MEQQRFTIVNHDSGLMYFPGAPVLMAARAVVKDNFGGGALAQCRFRSLAPKQILAMAVSLRCYGVDGEELAPVETFTYLDLAVPFYGEFGGKTAIPLPDAAARSFVLTLRKVIYSDNTQWENENGEAFAPVDTTQTELDALGELAPQYRREAVAALGDSCAGAQKYLPAKKAGGTALCGCGAFVPPGVEVCPVCGANLPALFALHNTDVLAEHLAAYTAEETRKAEVKRAKQKKTAKLLAIAACVVVLCTGGGILTKNVIIPAVQEKQWSGKWECIVPEWECEGLYVESEWNGGEPVCTITPSVGKVVTVDLDKYVTKDGVISYKQSFSISIDGSKGLTRETFQICGEQHGPIKVTRTSLYKSGNMYKFEEPLHECERVE